MKIYHLINYSYSLRSKIGKLEYYIVFNDKNNNSIIPSHLTLYYNLHLFCITKDIQKNISIFYIPNIDKNTYFKCIEYFQYNYQIKFGISLYKINNYIEYFNKFFITEKIANYNDLSSFKDSEYEPCLILEKYIKFENRIKANNKEKNILENLQLKKSYYKMPNFVIKILKASKEGVWYFNNLFKDYFCFCKSSRNSVCLYKKIYQKCKYLFYLNIIDNNRNTFNKTDYLFADFSSPETAPGEAFIIFNEMNKQNFNVHYMTKREDIYKKFSN